MNEVQTIPKEVVNKIDFCRGVFAILVMIAYSFDVATVSLPSFPVTFSGNILKHILGAGFYWVLGFFVISGFCIQLSCQKLKSKNGFPLKYYIKARLSRILPLYLFAFVIHLFMLLQEVLMVNTQCG